MLMRFFPPTQSLSKRKMKC